MIVLPLLISALRTRKERAGEGILFKHGVCIEVLWRDTS